MNNEFESGRAILFQAITLNEFSSGYTDAIAAENGISAVVLRATAGSNYTDAKLRDAVERAQAAGLRVGFYHYLIADDEAEARAQARFFCSVISGYGATIRPAMLFESLNGLSFDAANRIALAFLNEVQSSCGVTPAVYTDLESAKLLWNSTIAKRFPLWVIDENGGSPAPDLSSSPWSNWVGWQYKAALRPGCVGAPVSRFTGNMLASQIIPDPPAPVPRKKLICVIVSYGDTLSGIARLFNTTVDSIVRLNEIANPNRIYPGQRLYLLVDGGVPYECCDTYVVKKGDTLSKIGNRFGVDWRRLASINQIANPNRIYPGQEIKLGLCN